MKWLRHLFLGGWPALWLAAAGAQAQVVVWSDGFETNTPSRWQTSAVWKMGAPTTGPAVNNQGYRTHSGAACAYTQGYGYNKDVRLVCINYNGASTLQVPSADQGPVLRFWQWFNFGNALGYVEVSTDDGATWTNLSPTYLDLKSSGVWSRPELDLSAYADQSILIAFHFTSGGCCGNGLGWYVDDVEVDTETPVLNLPEGFESDPKTSGWSVDFGTWEIGRPTTGPKAAHLGTNCAATALNGSYSNNVDSRLISPAFVVPATSAVTLRYWQWYSFNNALGFVEVNNGSTTTTVTTNITITTNAVGTLVTNTYQFFGSTDTNYSAPFAWDAQTRSWTNQTKAFGSVFDTRYNQYYFESGPAPINSVGAVNSDYLVTSVFPLPQSTMPTNIYALQGVVWSSSRGLNNNPVGYFSTNYSVTYTTNTSTTVTTVSWVQLSPTIKNAQSGAWVSNSVDLSPYAGDTVQLAFHFQSGGIYSAVGWYVDDLSLVAAPTLTVPTNQVVNYGQKLTNWITANNSYEPDSSFTFALAAASTNVVVKTNGLVTWTNTNAPPGSYNVYVKVTDNNAPPFAVTNSFSVTVLPLPSQLVLTNAAVALATNGARNVKFSIKTPWTNNTWWLLAATNLNAASSNWFPIYTNKTGTAGSIQFTDRLATNFLQRYYRALFP